MMIPAWVWALAFFALAVSCIIGGDRLGFFACLTISAVWQAQARNEGKR